MSDYLTGVIEGFYGRPWSWSDRRSSVEFLRHQGLDAYVYAPKSDPFLRRQWAQPWPLETRRELSLLAEHCRSLGVRWGVGLSPLEAYRDYGPACLAQLKGKLGEIDKLEPDILCILFDDMKGDIPGLASLQARMVQDIADSTHAQRLIFCHTYNS